MSRLGDLYGHRRLLGVAAARRRSGHRREPRAAARGAHATAPQPARDAVDPGRAHHPRGSGAVFGAVFAAVMAALLVSLPGMAKPITSEAGYVTVWLVCSGLAIGVGVLALWLRRDAPDRLP